MYYKENHKELYPCSASTLFFILFFTVYGMVNQIQNGKNRNFKGFESLLFSATNRYGTPAPFQSIQWSSQLIQSNYHPGKTDGITNHRALSSTCPPNQLFKNRFQVLSHGYYKGLMEI